MLQSSNYTLLDKGLYEIPYATVLGRVPGSGSSFQDLGDWDSFSLNLNPTRKQRWTKRGAVSQLAEEVTTRIESQCTGKAMQKTGFVRAAALMGSIYPVQQAAGAVAPINVSFRVGDYLYLGAYGISAPVVQYDQGNGQMAALPPADVRLADPALGVVQIMGLPNDAHVAADGTVLGTYSATVAAGDVVPGQRVDIGTAPQSSLELIVRGESSIGQKGYLHILSANLAPDGEQGFITSNDDFEGVTLKGRANVAVDPGTGKSIVGYWRSLGA